MNGVANSLTFHLHVERAHYPVSPDSGARPTHIYCVVDPALRGAVRMALHPDRRYTDGLQVGTGISLSLFGRISSKAQGNHVRARQTRWSIKLALLPGNPGRRT